MPKNEAAGKSKGYVFMEYSTPEVWPSRLSHMAKQLWYCPAHMVTLRHHAPYGAHDRPNNLSLAVHGVHDQYVFASAKLNSSNTWCSKSVFESTCRMYSAPGKLEAHAVL
jgi:hypothetical protein